MRQLDTIHSYLREEPLHRLFYLFFYFIISSCKLESTQAAPPVPPSWTSSRAQADHYSRVVDISPVIQCCSTQNVFFSSEWVISVTAGGGFSFISVLKRETAGGEQMCLREKEEKILTRKMVAFARALESGNHVFKYWIIISLLIEERILQYSSNIGVCLLFDCFSITGSTASLFIPIISSALLQFGSPVYKPHRYHTIWTLCFFNRLQTYE